MEKKFCQKFIAESFHLTNILAEVKSVSPEHKTAFPDELFPQHFPVKAIQVRKFASKFARICLFTYLGLVARHLMRREKTGDNMD